MKSKKNKNIKPILTYIILFFIVWIVYETMIATSIKNIYPENIHTFSNLIIKSLVWILPIYLYLKFYDRKNPISYLLLDKHVKKGLIGVLALSLFLALYHFFRINLLGSLKSDFNIGLYTLLNTILLAGIAEEIVFRGFLLKKLWNLFSFKIAMICSSLLFVFIHYPIWFVRGRTLSLEFVIASLYIFIFGILQGYIFKKTNSLWVCIISHSIHNLFANIFILV